MAGAHRAGMQAGSVNDFAFFDPSMASRLPRPRHARRKTAKPTAPRAKPAARKEKFTMDFSSEVSGGGDVLLPLLAC